MKLRSQTALPSTRTLLAMAAALACLATTAHAQVLLISDSFDRGDGTTPLNGSSPDVGTGTWVEADDGAPFNTSSASYNGTNGYVFGGSDGSTHSIAELAFTPTNGNIYTLSAVLTISNPNSNNWMSLGFDNGSALSSDHEYGLGAFYATGPWLQLSGVASGNLSANGGAAGSGAPTSTTTSGYADETLTITLNTTNASDWTASFSAAGGTSFATFDLGSSESANISDILIGSQSQPGYFQNVTLTEQAETVPEPSTWAMMLGGGALLVGIQRMRRKQF